MTERGEAAALRVVIEYVCRSRHHRLAEVVATREGHMFRPLQVPLLDAGTAPGKLRHKATPAVPEDLSPLVGEPFWSTEVACGCGVEFSLTQEEVRADVASGVERVALDAKR